MLNFISKNARTLDKFLKYYFNQQKYSQLIAPMKYGVLFGGKKIPELMRGLGKGIREFNAAKSTIRDGIEEGMKEEKSADRSSDKKDDYAHNGFCS